jgi:AraC-like DNA-binding protein
VVSARNIGLPFGDVQPIFVEIGPSGAARLMDRTSPVYLNRMDDSPRLVAALARTWPDRDVIQTHMHRRGQLLHSLTGIMRIETAEAAWIVPPARALWMPPEMPHSVTMRGRVEMRTIYIQPAACAGLPDRATIVEISRQLRELILAALDEPQGDAESERGGIVARLMLSELARLQSRPLDVPMPRDPRGLRVARGLLEDCSIDLDLDGWADQSGASRRTLARIFRSETGLGFAEWRARLRAIDGLARLAEGDSVGETAASVGYASPSAFSAMIRRTLGGPPRRLVG